MVIVTETWGVLGRPELLNIAYSNNRVNLPINYFFIHFYFMSIYFINKVFYMEVTWRVSWTPNLRQSLRFRELNSLQLRMDTISSYSSLLSSWAVSAPDWLPWQHLHIKESTLKSFITTEQKGPVNKKKNRILFKGVKTKTICQFLNFTSDKK